MSHFSLLNNPSHFLFFTGKGGVGKTSLSCATAIALADRGKRVLLVSTDPASNLDEMLSVALTDLPTAVPGISGLFALNIDPETSAESYRMRVIRQLGPRATEAAKTTVREQLSGACTTEVAAFDEFVGLLTGNAPAYDHIIFDTAPTGHTLRLLSLPKAWTGFLEHNDHGASCLGPHSGLKMQEQRFREALQVLADPAVTTIVLVTRADTGAIREAARTSAELGDLGLTNQHLIINGRFVPTIDTDAVATAFASAQTLALAAMPQALAALPRDECRLLGFDMLGFDALRALLSDTPPPLPAIAPLVDATDDLPRFNQLVDAIALDKKGLIMVMGKGGVGKTTIAAAIAIGLAQRGHQVRLTTTDPAAHVSLVVNGSMPGLVVDRIDPAEETRNYIDKVMNGRGSKLSAEDRDLLREDLASPCTEEVAVFHAFSRVIADARDSFVVVDTAPTGHTLLLLDATGAYHRQMIQQMDTTYARLITPLMRLQDSSYTKVLLVTLPETTPVSEAAALQTDLRRAHIEPYAWIINRSMAAAHVTDPLLRARLPGESTQITRVATKFAYRTYLLDYRPVAPVGVEELGKLSR